jgi:tetratricopeptide (TPR) repeat protein
LELQEKYDPAKETLNIILIYVHSRHTAYYGIGLIKQFQKKFGEAEQNFLKTLENQEPYLDTYIRLANIYLDTNKLDDALPYIEKELKLNPESALGNLAMARYYGIKGNEKETEKNMELAIKFANDEPEIFERSAVHWANKGKFDKAIPLMEKLLQLKPNYKHGLNILAKAYYDSGKFDESLKYYERYVDLVTGDVEVLNNLANCYFKTADFESAERVYSEALKIDENFTIAYRNLGLTKINLHKYKEALPLLENYLDLSPHDIELEFALGAAYSEIEQYIEAIPHFEKFLANFPENIDGLFGISECYYNLGYTQSAIIGYSQILKLKPDFQPAIDRLNEVETTVSAT